MTDAADSTNPTAETDHAAAKRQIEIMREAGYVAYREANGRLAFVAADIYAAAIAAGLRPPGGSVQ